MGDLGLQKPFEVETPPGRNLHPKLEQQTSERERRTEQYILNNLK